MQDQINEVLELAKSISSQSAERNEIVDQLVKRLETMETETIQKAAVETEFEELKKQLADIQEQQMNIQLKGNINMSEITKSVNANEIVLKAIHGAEMGEDILTKANGMAVADADSAGVTVRTQYEQGVIRQAVEQSPFVSLISKFTSKNEDFRRIIEVGEYGSAWGEEDALNAGGQAGTAVAGYKEVRAVCGELTARPYVTSRILHDSDLNILAEVQNGVARAWARDLPRALLLGDGVKKPKGLLTFRAVAEKAKEDGARLHTAVQEIEVALADVAKVAMVDAIENLLVTLNSNYHSGASLMMHPRIYTELLKIRDTQGRSYLRPEVAQGTAMTLMGYPVVLNYDMPAAFKAGDVAIVFGDFAEAFGMVSVEGLTMIMDPYSKKPNVEFLHTQRFGSVQGNLSAVKFLTIKA